MVTHDDGGVSPNFFLSVYLNHFLCSPVALTIPLSYSRSNCSNTSDTIFFHTGSYRLAEYTNSKCNPHLPPHIILVHYSSLLLLFLYLCLHWGHLKCDGDILCNKVSAVNKRKDEVICRTINTTCKKYLNFTFFNILVETYSLQAFSILCITCHSLFVEKFVSIHLPACDNCCNCIDVGYIWYEESVQNYNQIKF